MSSITLKSDKIYLKLSENNLEKVNKIIYDSYEYQVTAIDKVLINTNRSPLVSEILAHRLGLLPFPYFPDPENLVGKLNTEKNTESGNLINQKIITNYDIELTYKGQEIFLKDYNIPIINIIALDQRFNNRIDVEFNFVNGCKNTDKTGINEHGKFAMFSKLSFNENYTEIIVDLDYEPIKEEKERLIEFFSKLI